MIILRKLLFMTICSVYYIYYVIKWNIRPLPENMFLSKYLSISIMKRILGTDNIKRCESIFMKNIINVEVYLHLLLTYVKLIYPIMPKITNIDENNSLDGKEKRLLYLTFHFTGNYEGLIYYLSQKHDECYFVYHKDLMKSFVKSSLGVDTMEASNNLEYVRYYNQNFNLKFINSQSPTVLLKIKHILQEGKPVVTSFDEFKHMIKFKKRPNERSVEYKINNKTAALAPKALFDIAARTDTTIIPIVNLRKGFIVNNLKIFKPIIYNKGNDPAVEYERMLKELYGDLLDCIRGNPVMLNSSIWSLFREYVKDNSSMKERNFDFQINDKYKTQENNFEYFKNTKQNYWLLIKIDNFRVIKVDDLAVKIFKHIQKGDKLPANLLRKEKDEDIKKRIDYLLQTGYIVKC